MNKCKYRIKKIYNVKWSNCLIFIEVMAYFSDLCNLHNIIFLSTLYLPILLLGNIALQLPKSVISLKKVTFFRKLISNF